MHISEVSELDWQQYVSKLNYSTMFQAWEWARFERDMGNEFLTLGVFKSAVLVGLLPIKVIKAKRGKYLHVRHGPIIDWNNSELVAFVLGFLKNLAEEKGVDFVRISPLIRKESIDFQKLGLREAPVHSVDAELTVVVDLTQSESQIMKDMRKNTRNLIRKAEKLGMVVKHGTDNELYSDFIKLYTDTVNYHGWYAYSTDYVRKEFDVFAQAGKVEIFVTYFQGKPVSGSLFLTQNNQVIYHHSGSDHSTNVPAAYLLHWEAIKYYKQHGYELYNFWGVSPESDKKSAWYGLSLFKRGFTKNELEFVHAQDLIVKPFAHVTRFYEWLEAKGLLNFRTRKSL